MRALGSNWGVFSAFLVVAGGVSLLTAFTTMPPLDENGQPLARNLSLADAGAPASGTEDRRTNPFVLALDMTNPLSRRSEDIGASAEPAAAGPIAGEPVATEPVVTEPVAVEPGDPALAAPEPLADEMLEIAQHLAAIAPAAGGSDALGSWAPSVDDTLDDSAGTAPPQVAQLSPPEGDAGTRGESLFGSYRATEDSPHMYGTPSARERAVEKAPAEATLARPADATPAAPPAANPVISVPVVPGSLAALAATAPAAQKATTEAAPPKAKALVSGRKARYVVIGSFRRRALAEVVQRERQSWSPDILPAEVKGKAYHRVVLGPFDPAEAKQVREAVAAQGIKDPWTLAPPKTATVSLRRSADLGLGG